MYTFLDSNKLKERGWGGSSNYFQENDSVF